MTFLLVDSRVLANWAICRLDDSDCTFGTFVWINNYNLYRDSWSNDHYSLKGLLLSIDAWHRGAEEWGYWHAVTAREIRCRRLCARERRSRRGTLHILVSVPKLEEEARSSPSTTPTSKSRSVVCSQTPFCWLWARQNSDWSLFNSTVDSRVPYESGLTPRQFKLLIYEFTSS